MGRASRARATAIAAAAIGAVVLVAACYPQPATSEARTIGSFYNFVLGLALVVVFIVWGLLTLAIVRYRRRRREAATEDEIPPQIGGHLGLEALWTGGPLLTIVVLFVMTLVVLNEVQGEREVTGAPTEGAVQLEVDAFRWGWRMNYPVEGVSVVGVLDPGPEAVVPVGRPVSITLSSSDVVHSFYVPQFLYKRDALPGRPNRFEVTIEEAGVYRGQCAEYCGLFHARMPFSIRAVGDAEYQSWLAAQRAAGATPGATP